MRLAFLALAVALSSTVAAAPDGTLDRAVRPTAQAVHLVLDPARPTFHGTTRITLQVEAPVRRFSLHAAGPKVGAARLTGAAGSLTPTLAPGPAETLVVEAPGTLAPGAWTLDLAFEAPFDEQATGLYRTLVGDSWYAFTQFQADDARQAFPCFDEPAHKVPWELSLDVPAGLDVVANTPAAADTVAHGRRHVRFEPTPPMPSYLVALAVGTFDMVPVPGMRVPTRVITTKGQGGLAAEAIRVTPPLLAELERWFTRPYPYAKLDLIAVPEFWPGAMENVGAITFAEDVLLSDPKVAMTQVQRRELAITVSHELAHMWFGNLVTMAWWDDLWLSESFASWMGNKAVHAVFPGLDLPVHAVTSAQLALELDARRTTRAIRQPVAATDNLMQLADELAYEKGEAVLGMVEAWLGPDVFRKGVLIYLDRHAWGSATGADLWRALGEAAGRDVHGPLASFVDQAGVPLVDVAPVEAGVRLRQSRFSHAGVAMPATTWQVPVGLRYARGGRVYDLDVLLSGPEQVVGLPGTGALDWVHPHADAHGYYRWTLPSPLLRAAAAAAPTRLTVAERVGFVGNLAALLDAALVGGDDYLQILGSFAGDPDPRVVSAALDGLAAVKPALVAPPSEPAFASWVRDRFAPTLARLGREARPGESEGGPELRAKLVWWLGQHGDEDVRGWARTLAQKHLERPGSVEAAVVGVALRLSARHGDRALFETLRSRLGQAESATERHRVLSALASFDDPALADAALAYALTGPLRSQELWTIPAFVSGVPGHEDRALSWTVANYREIARRLPPAALVYVPYVAGGCSLERLARAEAFFGGLDVPGLDRELAALAESVRSCAALREREGARAAAFLVSPATPSATRVLLDTELGEIELEVDGLRAPATAANFLRYVEEGRYDGGVFHRTVRDGNQPGQAVTIDVVQASVAPAHQDHDHPAIALERTRETGLEHLDGTVSMARAEPDTATSDFFICIGPQPELDFGGRRNPDGQGFAAFGRVVRGMDVVRRIQAARADGQKLTPPLVIRSARRLPGS